MKRLKCYGRKKTVCIDTAANNIFAGDQNNFLWNQDNIPWNSSSGSDKDFAPRKEYNKTPISQKKAKKTNRTKSTHLYLSSADLPIFNLDVDVDENKENKIKAKTKLKTKKGKYKKPTKKQVYASVDINEPRWSIIDEHDLQIEGKAVRNKRRNMSPVIEPTKHSCLAAVVENQPSNKELRCGLKQLESNIDEPRIEVRDDSGLAVPRRSGRRNQREVLKDSVNFGFDGNGNGGINFGLTEICVPRLPGRRNWRKALKDSVNSNSGTVKNVGANSGLIELALPSTSNSRNRSEVVEDSTNFNSESVKDDRDFSGFAESAVPSVSGSRTRSKVLKDAKNSNSESVRDNSGFAELPVPFASNSRNRSKLLKDSVNSNSASVAKVSQEIEIEAAVSHAVEELEEQRLSNINVEEQSRVHQNHVNLSVIESSVGKDVSMDEAVAVEKRNKSINLVNSPAVFLIPKAKKDVAVVPSAPSSPDLSCRMSSTSINRRFEISSMSSFSKNLKIITSTPTVSSRTRFPAKMSLLNLSQIYPFEKDCSASKKASSRFSKISLSFQNRMCSRNPSLLIFQHKSRSLDVLQDSSKLGRKLSRLSSSSQIQHASKSNKSYSCLEKVSSALSLNSSTDIYESQSVVEKLIQLCGQEAIEPFATAYDWSLITVNKVGEGTYGEVFMLSVKKKSSVIKIIPVSQDSANSWLNVETVYSEVKVCQCLSELRINKYNKTSNFNKLNSIHFVKGSYPDKLLAAWDTFSANKTSYNVRPDCFDEEQLYVILNMEYGGTDMDSFVMKNAVEAESILKQVAISLAIAEETHLFEHRDLHLGNILVQRVKKKNVSYVLRGKSISIPSHGLMVTIIDFTLSRIFDSGCVYYNDLADDNSLFNQSGDYQFEIYRATRDILKNQWREGSLYSNVLWLTFLCVKMNQHRYSRPTSATHLKCLNNIATFKNDLKMCKSAFDCLQTCRILLSVPKNSQSVESKRKGKTVFVDRKSFQKSKLSIQN